MILVDTNVISELTRPRPAPSVVKWIGGLDAVALSVITIDEVFFGLTTRPNAKILRWFEVFLDTHCRLLEITPPIARHAGILRGQLASKGRARSQADMLIAATAAVHGASLATRNERDFADCGVAIVNPFA